MSTEPLYVSGRTWCRVEGEGFRVCGSVFTAEGSEFMVWCSRFTVYNSGFSVDGLRFRVWGAGGRVKSVGARAPLTAWGFRVYGQGLVLGLACWGIAMNPLLRRESCVF